MINPENHEDLCSIIRNTYSSRLNFPGQQWLLDDIRMKLIKPLNRFSTLLKLNFWKVSEISKSSLAFVLLSNGGTENQSESKHFANTLPPLEHLIAQKDIIFSNAMIEHLNKTIKYRYLYQQPIHNRQHLEKMLQQAVLNYNNRPVHILQGLTPLEVLNNNIPDLNHTKENIHKAVRSRININNDGDCCL